MKKEKTRKERILESLAALWIIVGMVVFELIWVYFLCVVGAAIMAVLAKTLYLQIKKIKQ